MFGLELSVFAILIIQLAYVWLVTFLSTKRIGESKVIVNIGTAFKVIILLGIGLLGIYAFAKNGVSANPIEGFGDLIPTMDLGSLSFISIIIFNFMGFEVVGTWVDDMENPKKQIPKALIIGGILMAILYILPATGFNIALPANDEWLGAGAEIFVDVLRALFESVGFGEAISGTLVIVFCVMLIYTFIANIASWSFGVNEVAKYAADDGSLPKAFSPVNEEGVPYKAAIINGVVASIICIIGIVAVEVSEDLSGMFGIFFCLSWITLLVGYTPMFLAFIKLRKTDPNAKRPYRMPGSETFAKVYSIIAFFLIVAGIIFTIFGDFTIDYMKEYLPLYAGVVLSFILEEIFVARIKK
jgi:amino acid transporter